MEHLYKKPLSCICVAHESAQEALLDKLDEDYFQEAAKLRSTNYKLKVDDDFKVCI